MLNFSNGITPENPFPKAKNTLGIIFFPAYDWALFHDHPEREERLLYTHDQLREEGIFDVDGIFEHKPGMANEDDISAVHFCPPGFDTVVETPHYISAGAAMKAGELVLSGAVSKSFALTRPPGHHAMRIIQGGRGFCAINIVAVMTEKIRRDYGVQRIAIIDTDCHHGDGTQDIYWHDPNILFISLHQDGKTLYPGTGCSSEEGGPLAHGTTVNVPLPPRTGDEGHLYAVNNIVRPILDAWKPELIICSAGQDSHFSDPITNMNLTARGYGDLITAINPDIAVLEGGYSIQGALPYVNLAVALAMAGMDYSRVLEPRLALCQVGTSADIMEYIKRLADHIHDMRKSGHDQHHEYHLANGWWKRSRSIHYDTDYLEEIQHEKLRACGTCPGVLITETKTHKQKNSLTVLYPRGVCTRCHAEGENAFINARRKGNRTESIDQETGTYRRE